MDAPGSLRQFQQALAERMRKASPVSAAGTRLGVLADERRWLIPIDQVGEILPLPVLTPVAMTPAWFAGLANVRGNIISVVDLGLFQRRGDALASPSAGHLVLLAERLGSQCGLLVQEVLALKRLEVLQRVDSPDESKAQAHLGAEDAPWLVGSYREPSEDSTANALHGSPRGLWHEIDLVRLCTSGRFLGLHTAP
jgi:twitching motility protein PilI